MEPIKDIRITEKKVDESWKEQIERDRTRLAPEPPLPAPSASNPKTSAPRSAQDNAVTSAELLNLINTLAYQALLHLGEIPEAQGVEVNLEAAREAIELLRALQLKTQGNLSQQESTILNALLPELQMKFTQHA